MWSQVQRLGAEDCIMADVESAPLTRYVEFHLSISSCLYLFVLSESNLFVILPLSTPRHKTQMCFFFFFFSFPFLSSPFLSLFIYIASKTRNISPHLVRY